MVVFKESLAILVIFPAITLSCEVQVDPVQQTTRLDHELRKVSQLLIISLETIALPKMLM